MKPIIMVHLVHEKGETLVFNLEQVRSVQTYPGEDDDMKTHISFVGEDPETRGYRTSITVSQISEAIQRASREFSAANAGPLHSIIIKE